MHPARPTYNERVKLTRAALDDTANLLRLHRLVASVDALAAPAAHIISAPQPLAASRRVGLFPGSFNPLTRAHLAIAEAARQPAALDTVVWAISAVTVDKERVQRASVSDRLAQLASLIQATPRDSVAVLNRGLYVEEAEALRTHLARDAQLYIIVGFDKIVQIFDPRYYSDRDAALRGLFALAHILVAPREDLGADALAELLGRPENRPFAPHVQYVPVSLEHTRDSSTQARALAATRPFPSVPLRRLLAPEGYALARTGAYTEVIANATGDRYELRKRWLTALDTLGDFGSQPLPPLSRLVALTAPSTTAGARLRAWLANPTATAIPPEVC